MDQFRDYTVRNGIGIRLFINNKCRVIRHVRMEWIEIGPVYSVPVEANILNWPRNGIPASVLAVALRFCELEAPSTALRGMLTGAHPGALLHQPAETAVGPSQW
jgi:hypothetical protein